VQIICPQKILSAVFPFQTSPRAEPTAQNSPNHLKTCSKHPKLCLFHSFSAQKSQLNTKNPSGIVSIPDGFHGGSRRIRTIDLPGMKCRKLIPDDNYTVIFHHKTLRYFKACLGVSMSIHFLNSIPKLFNP